MWPSFLSTAFALILRIWDLFSGRAKKKLEDRRLELEAASRQAQIDGDLDDLRKFRAEIDEIDRKLQSGDY